MNLNLSRIFLSFITSFITTFMLLNNSCNALDTGEASFMDFERSVKELQSLVSKNSPGIVSVSVYDDTGALKGEGSGFFLNNEGRIITNASIWKDAYSAGVLSELNSYNEIVILNRNEDIDIALIKVKAINETPLELDFNYKTSLGERVVVFGKSRDLANTVSEGLVSSLSEESENLKLFEIRTTASILPFQASTNGPVLNTDGKVIGVVASNTFSDRKISDDTWRGFNNDQMFAISLQSIKPLLSESGHIEYLHRAKSKVWFRWFVSSLKSMLLTGFLYIYNIGFSKLIALLFVVVIIIYIFELLYSKYIKPKYGR